MAYFRCSTGSASSGDGVALVVTCDQDFAGSVITATNGTDTFTETCPSVSPYTVRFEGIPTGTYTISGVSQGQTFTTQFTVLDYETTLNATPEGATVLPVNDIQIWLHCANIWDKNYTTLDEVLADNTTLLALISDNNAVDYMVRSTDWASDSNVGLVPTMTSDTTPSGECFQVNKHDASQYAAYKCFDGDSSTFTFFDNGTYSSDGYYIGYDFGKPVDIRTYTVSKFSGSGNLPKIRLIGSNDKVNWTPCTSYKTPTGYAEGATDTASDSHSFRYWAIQGDNKYWAPYEIQFFGAPGVVENQTAMGYIGNNDYCADTLLADATWCEAICNSEYFESVLNVKVPTMTSDTTPSGTASASSVIAANFAAWKAFNGTYADETNAWGATANTTNQWVSYQFTQNVMVKKVVLHQRGKDTNLSTKDFKIQAFSNGTTWIDLSGTETMPNQTSAEKTLLLTNANSNSKYNRFRLFLLDVGYGSVPGIGELQFYGRA